MNPKTIISQVEDPDKIEELWQLQVKTLPEPKELLKSIPKIKGGAGLPTNNIFPMLQFINLGKDKEIRGNTLISFEGYTPANLEEKAIFLSSFYALVSFAKEGENTIKLTDLMEKIGFRKKEIWKYYNKEKVLRIVEKIKDLKITFTFLNEIPRSIKELYPNAKQGDKFKVGAFIIYTVEHYTKKHLKDAVIYFYPLFVPKAIFLEKTRALSLPLDEPAYRLLCIHLSYGASLNNKFSVKVEELLNVAGIELDEEHPKRTYEKLRALLRRAKEDGIISYYSYQGFDTDNVGEKGWVEKWLASEIKIEA